MLDLILGADSNVFVIKWILKYIGGDVVEVLVPGGQYPGGLCPSVYVRVVISCNLPLGTGFYVVPDLAYILNSANHCIMSRNP